MTELAFVNGAFLPINEAVVPIEDRGFQFADAVYEVVATYGGVPFKLDEHIERLQNSLNALRISYDVYAECVAEIIAEGMQRAGFDETLIYLQISRGVAARMHDFPSNAKPTVVMTFKPCYRLPVTLYESGVSTITRRDLRWKRCDIKTVSLAANVLVKQEATEAGAFEVLLVDDDGWITEGSSTSCFLAVEGILKTTPLSPDILPSITRRVVLDLAEQMAIPVSEETSSRQEYLDADEVFLVGTATEVMPVVDVDGLCVGSGSPGPLAIRLRQAFIELTRSV